MENIVKMDEIILCSVCGKVMSDNFLDHLKNLLSYPYDRSFKKRISDKIEQLNDSKSNSN